MLHMARCQQLDGRQFGYTVKAHSSGPDVDNGRCPNLTCFVSFGCEVILRSERYDRGKRYGMAGDRGQLSYNVCKKRDGQDIVNLANRSEENCGRKRRVE